MASDSSSIKPITLHFQNVVRVAGETIEGRVDLNESLAREDGIEHLRIEMRGVVKTRITSQFIGGRVVITNTQAVSSEQIDLDVFSFPFRFTLPGDLPSSFFYGKGSPPGILWKSSRIDLATGTAESGETSWSCLLLQKANY
ncbi:hypothetical protein K438DRAFT_2031855 [Mycena galopus ATCC 62051]|nr:hypothetical protein K438DRAFT_2031855 [Mycena galopus ATCC 62051]